MYYSQQILFGVLTLLFTTWLLYNLNYITSCNTVNGSDVTNLGLIQPYTIVPINSPPEGFITKPLTIDTAMLCDTRSMPILKGSWECDSDITCRNCSRAFIKRFNKLSNAYNKSSLRKIRINEIKMRFSSEDTVVVSSINYGQLYLFMNWYCSLLSIGVDPRDFTVMVPIDEPTKLYLDKLGFYTTPIDWVYTMQTKISSKYSTHSANVGAHADVNNILLLQSAEILLQTNKNVLVSDVDIVWLNPNVIADLKHRIGSLDLLGMISPYYNAKSVMNTGFMYFRNTIKSRLFIETVVNLAGIKQSSDQKLFNIVLRHPRLSTYNYDILPNELYYKYGGRKAIPPSEKAMLYHGVGIEKRNRFEYYNLWFHNITCRVFDVELDHIH